METNNNILELRQKIQRRLRAFQIFCIVESIFLLFYLWHLISDFQSQTIINNIIYGLLFLCLSYNNWTHYKLLRPAKEKLRSVDITELEECYKRTNSMYKRGIIAVVGTVILIILIMVSMYLYVITHYEIRG